MKKTSSKGAGSFHQLYHWSVVFTGEHEVCNFAITGDSMKNSKKSYLNRIAVCKWAFCEQF